ncbi:hypothetical protein [Deinococcus enclensis]|uniref:Uncharacterized protein n=1 Tax=Deinococcus enclensis TaxID=1049582 RepID=A0ABT9MHP9_9DEIO|nr:hypothetical protein [Deinococcus enclensis]MDP9766117.1 hypothetical protein [Deinococcus enclensis]
MLLFFILIGTALAIYSFFAGDGTQEAENFGEQLAKDLDLFNGRKYDD